jgi:hypothetical protein
VNEKTGAQKRTLFKGAIDRENGLRDDVLVVNVGGDADDAARREKTSLFEISPRGELQHGIGPIDMPIDRILIGEHALCESFADDNDGLLITVPIIIIRIIILLTIERIEIAADQYCPEDGFKDSANPMQSKGLNAVLVFFDLKSEKSKTAFSKENR